MAACMWVEGQRSRNTCSTGPTAQVALRLHRRDPRRAVPRVRASARWRSSMHRYATMTGLYRDHVRADGTIEPTVWSYNQGTPIGAAVLLARSTGDNTWLDRAVETAAATRAHFCRGRPAVATAAGVQRHPLPQPARACRRWLTRSTCSTSSTSTSSGSGPMLVIGAPGCSWTGASAATTGTRRSTRPASPRCSPSGRGRPSAGRTSVSAGTPANLTA